MKHNIIFHKNQKNKVTMHLKFEKQGYASLLSTYYKQFCIY